MRKFSNGGWIASMQDKAARNRRASIDSQEDRAVRSTGTPAKPAEKPASAPAMSQADFSYGKKKYAAGGPVRDKFKRACGR